MSAVCGTYDWWCVEVADVVHTPRRGQLQCRYVVHTVGPVWPLSSDDTARCTQLLQRTFENVLDYSHRLLHATSVAIPAIGTGRLLLFNGRDVKASRPERSRGQNFGLGLKALVSASALVSSTWSRLGLSLVVLASLKLKTHAKVQPILWQVLITTR